MHHLTTSAFDLPDHLAAKADPALIAGDEQHFAAIAESLEQSIADLSDRLDAAAQGARRHRAGGDGPRPGDPPADRPAARPASLRPGPVPGAHGRRGRPPSPCTSAGSASPTATGRRLLVDWRSPAAEPFFGATHANPMGLASRRRYRWTRGRISDYWDEVFTAGRVRRARRPRRPVRLHRQPGQQPVAPDARRARHHPGRPGRHHPRGLPRRARRRRRSGHRQDRRRPAPHGVPALLRPAPRPPPRRRAVRRAAPALPGLRRRRPPQPRRGGRADLHPARPRPRGSRGSDRDRPGGGPPEVVRGHGDGDRAGGPALRGAADRGHGGRDALGRRLAQRRRLGRGVRGARPRYAAQRGARPGLGGAAHDPGRQARRRGRPGRPAPQVAARRTRS